MKPQSVTDRYVSRILLRGRNDTFELGDVSQKASYVEDLCVGTYYEVSVHTLAPVDTQNGIGATPMQALKRALEKHGVTFR